MIVKKFLQICIILSNASTIFCSQTLPTITVHFQTAVNNKRFLRHFMAKTRHADKIYVFTYDLGVAYAINSLVEAQQRNADIRILVGTLNVDTTMNDPNVLYVISLGIPVQAYLDTNPDNQGINCYFKNSSGEMMLISALNLSTYTDTTPTSYTLTSNPAVVSSFLNQFNSLWQS
jgi:hypothetical protein